MFLMLSGNFQRTCSKNISLFQMTRKQMAFAQLAQIGIDDLAAGAQEPAGLAGVEAAWQAGGLIAFEDSVLPVEEQIQLWSDAQPCRNKRNVNQNIRQPAGC